jgi:quercetin dioxygenase-like cupin family protein
VLPARASGRGACAYASICEHCPKHPHRHGYLPVLAAQHVNRSRRITMESRPKPPTVRAPAKWVTGDVYIDNVVQPDGNSQLSVRDAHFTPGARTAWHSHEGGQTLYVTEGRGLVQARGGPAIEVRAGDIVWTPDGEEHWHGAAHDHYMTHLSFTLGPATWGEHVTDAEYGWHTSSSPAQNVGRLAT